MRFDEVVAFVGAPIALAALGAGFGMLYRDIPQSGATARNARVSAAVVAFGALTWIAVTWVVRPEVDAALLPAIAVMAGVAALLASLAGRERGIAAPGALVFTVGWVALVFVPVATAVFAPELLFRATGLELLDHGGAIPVFIAPAASGLAILLIERRPRVGTAPHAYPTLPSWLSLAVWASWSIALVFLELAVDEATPRIVLNVVVAPLCGALGWLVMQRIHHEATTVAGAWAGLVSGLAAVTAGAAFLDPLWAGVTGFTAATLGASLVHRRSRASGFRSWFVVGVYLVAPAVGLLLLALFAGELGFVFSGQLGLVVAETTAIVVVAGYSVAVSAILWLLVRHWGSPRGTSG